MDCFCFFSTTNEQFWDTFPWQDFSLTIPWRLTQSLIFPWHVSNSLTFRAFPDKWSPCVTRTTFPAACTASSWRHRWLERGWRRLTADERRTLPSRCMCSPDGSPLAVNQISSSCAAAEAPPTRLCAALEPVKGTGKGNGVDSNSASTCTHL